MEYPLILWFSSLECCSSWKRELSCSRSRLCSLKCLSGHLCIVFKMYSLSCRLSLPLVHQCNSSMSPLNKHYCNRLRPPSCHHHRLRLAGRSCPRMWLGKAHCWGLWHQRCKCKWRLHSVPWELHCHTSYRFECCLLLTSWCTRG